MIKMNKHGVNVVVDGLTDCLEERRSGAIVDTYYKIVDRQLKPGDSRGWKFSLDNGCDGFVAFTAKSDLIEHYQKELGAFLVIDRRMCIDDIAAGKLIEKYFKEENHHV